MRINLGTDTRQGYINVGKTPGPNITLGDFKNLTGITQDGTAEELVAIDVVQYIDHANLLGVLSNWVSKLSKGGEIYIQAPDSSLLGTIMQYEQTTVEQINKLIFGDSEKNRAVGIYNLTGFDTLLRNLGMEIISKTYVGQTHFGIRARKSV